MSSNVNVQAVFSRAGKNGLLIHVTAEDAGKAEQLSAELGRGTSVQVVVSLPRTYNGHMPAPVRPNAYVFHKNTTTSRDPSADSVVGKDALAPLLGMPLDQIEKLIVERTISENEGSIPKAAKVLGVSPSTLYRKLDNWRR